MIAKPSLSRRMLVGQLCILLVFASFAAINFVWSFYREQGNLQKTLEHFAHRFGPIADRHLTDQPNPTELKAMALTYSEWAADDISLAKLNQPATESNFKIFFAIQTKEGDLIFRNDAIKPNFKLPSIIEGLSDIQIEGRDWKMVSVFTPNGKHKIVFGEPSDVAAIAVSRILIDYIIYPLAFFLPIAAILMGLVIRFGIKPLNRLTETIAKRNPDSLDALTIAKPYTETTPLVNAINNLMIKISGTLARERRFLADAAHELRTPLAVIQAQAHLLEIAGNTAERQLAARQLDRGVGRAASLIAKLLTSAQINSDEFKYEFELLEVNSLVQERIAALSILAIKKNIDLSFHQTELMSASISKPLFVSAFDNVLENAIRYTPEHGAVEVSVRTGKNAHFIVAVLDSGPGIDADKIERVFERFYRVEGTEEQGSGLGLSIVLQAMQAHHGQIKLQPGPKGIGLLAELTAPLSAPHSDV